MKTNRHSAAGRRVLSKEFKHNRLYRAVLLVALMGATSSSAWAQISSDARVYSNNAGQSANGTVGTAGASTGNVSTLGAIEVTAEPENDVALSEGSDSYTATASRAGTGLALSLRETPQSVSVMSNQLMKDKQLTSTEAVMDAAIGISTEPMDTNRVRYLSRGFEVANYMFDGVSTEISARGVNMGGESDIDTFIFDRVEIVRGANGLMQGVGDPSASVNYIRKRADSKVFSAEVTSGLGDHDKYRTAIDLSTPLNTSGTVRGRVVGVYENKDSFRDRIEDKHSTVLATAEADITDTTNFRVGFSYQDNESKGMPWFGSPVFYSDGSETDFHRGVNPGADWARQKTSWLSTYAGLEQKLGNDWELKGLFSFSRNWHDTKKLGVRGFPDRQTGIMQDPAGASGRSANHGRPSVINNNGNHYQRAFDLRLNGPFELFGQTHELMMGANYNYRTELYFSRNPLDRKLAPAGSFFDWDGSFPEPAWGENQLNVDGKVKEKGVFLATRLNPTDWLHVILGARWTSWDKSIQGRNPYEFKKHHVTPYAGLLVDFLDNYTAYFSYTDVFRPQDSLTRDGGYIDPVQGTNYELGLKGSWFDNRLNASAAVFQTELDNVAEQYSDVYVQGQPDTLASHAVDGTKSRGVEFEVNGALSDQWQVFGGVTYWTGHDQDGNAIKTIQPSTSVKLFTRYKFQGKLNGLTVGGGIKWQSRVYDDFSSPVFKGEKQRFQQNSYPLVDLMARYQINDKVGVQANVNNVFDRKYFQIGRANTGIYGAGTNFMVNVDFKY